MLNFLVEGLDQFKAGNVRNTAKGEGLGRVRRRGVVLRRGRPWGCHVFPDRTNDGIHQWVVPTHEEGQRRVSDVLFRILVASDQCQYLCMAKVDIVP